MKETHVVMILSKREKGDKATLVCAFPKAEVAEAFVEKCEQYSKEFPGSNGVVRGVVSSTIERRLKISVWEKNHPLRDYNQSISISPKDTFHIAAIPSPGYADPTYYDPESEFERIRKELTEAGLQLRATESWDSSPTSMVITDDMRQVATICWDSRQSRVMFRRREDIEKYPVLSELNERLRQGLRKMN